MKLKRLTKKKDIEEPLRRPVPELTPDSELGLSSAQAQERVDAGWANLPIDPPGKTVGQIVRSNVFTYFNMLFFFLAAFVLVFGTWQNVMFMGVVLANIAIGIVQELRSKRTLDKLTLLTAPGRRHPRRPAGGRSPRARWSGTTSSCSRPGTRSSRTPLSSRASAA